MPPPPVFTIGYEGRSVADFVARVVAARVETIVDVRTTPLSRKPGFSKKALGVALAEVGVEYIHDRRLGNPKDNRRGFSAPATRPAAHARYRAHLNNGSRPGFDLLAEMSKTTRCALLCFEANHAECHRSLIASQLEAEFGLAVVHL